MKWNLLFAALALISSTALATPAQVLVIRHGEKADDGNLSPKGWRRAEALVKLFTSDPRVTQYGPPVAIFASAPKHENSAMRTIQTVTPLAAALNIPIDEDFTKKQIDDLAKRIFSEPSYDGKTVLICWHHKYIPDIVDAFGAKPPSQKWKGSVFDRIWAVQFKHGHAIVDDLGERVLPGDT